ncbi:MAG TPA: M20 family metallopeptidase [Beijerinckiaceae bacterium]|jgi:acetylornithine deacetylase/succinyl-diaminopimelate desuccinylase-like protein
MSRDAAIARALDHFTSGAFRAELARRVAIPTESQNPARAGDLERYLDEEMQPAFERLGFACRRLGERDRAGGPVLYAERIEDPEGVTALGYGHGDVIRGLDASWEPGLSPWTLTERGDRWYGRGVVDNKGQHAIHLAALDAVLRTRGKLGFNAKWVIEMGEEVGSPGLRDLFFAHRELLAADVLLASDGPRLNQERPTVFLGARGGASFDLWIDAREGGHHSGNWGGLLSNPGIQLAHALASLVGPTGQIRVPDLVPPEVPASVRRALADCELETRPGAPVIDPTWGEPGLTGPEKVFGWCALEVLAYECGTPATPVNAIPPRAWARCQLRFVVGIDMDNILPAIRRHLDRQGFAYVQVAPARDEVFPATRLDPDHPWVRWAVASIAASTGKNPAVLPNLGGSLPNDVFSDILGLPTVWVPHSYPGCSQHAPNEHLPVAIAREGLAMMAGLYWDLGEKGVPTGSRAPAGLETA